jgi:anti-sigma regulatory factor (Ser/Thr protein kinase)
MELELNDKIILMLPAKEEYISLVRLLVSGFAVKLNFDYDEIEEIKIAVSELAMNCVKYAYKQDTKDKEIKVTCIARANQLEVHVEDHGAGFNLEQEEWHNGFGFTFLKQYMELVEVDSKIGKGTSIAFRKKHAMHL